MNTKITLKVDTLSVLIARNTRHRRLRGTRTFVSVSSIAHEYFKYFVIYDTGGLSVSRGFRLAFGFIRIAQNRRLQRQINLK